MQTSRKLTMNRGAKVQTRMGTVRAGMKTKVATIGPSRWKRKRAVRSSLGDLRSDGGSRSAPAAMTAEAADAPAYTWLQTPGEITVEVRIPLALEGNLLPQSQNADYDSKDFPAYLPGLSNICTVRV